MFEFPRIDKTAEAILKLLKERRANPDNIAYALKIEKKNIGEILRFLLQKEYIANATTGHYESKEVFAHDDYRITINGKNYLASVKFYGEKDRRQFWINIINGSIAFSAFVRAFWSDIIAGIERLMQLWQG